MKKLLIIFFSIANAGVNEVGSWKDELGIYKE